MKTKKPNWDKIRAMMEYITEAGGVVVNQHKKPRTFQLPHSPGLKLLAAGDCLTNYGGFVREYEEDELHRLQMIRLGYNVAEI